MSDAARSPENCLSSDDAVLLRQAWAELAAGAWAASRRLCEPVLVRDGNHPDALHVTALALWGEGDLAGAIACLTRAAAMEPVEPSRFSDLGVLHFENQDWPQALRSFAACRLLQPEEPTALQGEAETLVRLGRYAEATAAAQEWMRVAPADKAASRLLAHCLALDNRLDEASALAERNLIGDPESEATLTLLAAICAKLRQFERALLYAQTAARIHPNSSEAAARLAAACWNVGDPLGAQSARAHALQLGVTHPNLAASLDWLSLHEPDQTAASLLAGHRASALAWCGMASSPPPHGNSPDPARRLRVGYLSGEFMSNAAYWFLVPWLRCHDPLQVETFYYMTRPVRDQATERYQTIAHHWSGVAALTDDALAQQIRADSIDILVDLSGHFEDNRLGVFGRRPAPVQMTYPNYPGTTGLSAVDYIFTDLWTTPAGCEAEYAETPYRLPTGCLVFLAPEGEAGTSPLPASSNGYVTFGLFQRPGKLHAALWDAIAAVLRQVPDSRLLLHFASAELEEAGSPQSARLLAELGARGIAPHRVLFRGTRATPGHLAVVAEADIALDSFPYNGQTTTCDCLWMGVPVVSLRGHTHVSRVTPALLDRMGLSHLAAGSPDDYVRTAVALAADRPALVQLRSTLRATMHSCSLTSGDRLAREIEATYRDVWIRWCNTVADSNGG